MCGMKKYVCDKCLHKISLVSIVVTNNKLVCPYCSHTLETDKFKVHQVEIEQGKKKEEISYDDKSTDKKV